MNASEAFGLGNQFQQEGRMDMALEMWRKAIGIDPMFGPAHLNLFNVAKGQNNLPQAREQLIRFLNCPITGFTLEAIPRIRQELAEIEKQLGIVPK